MGKIYQIQNMTCGTSALEIYRPMPVDLPAGQCEVISLPKPSDYIREYYQEDVELLKNGSLSGRRIEGLAISDKIVAIACFVTLIVATFSAILVLPFL